MAKIDDSIIIPKNIKNIYRFKIPAINLLSESTYCDPDVDAIKDKSIDNISDF